MNQLFILTLIFLLIFILLPQYNNVKSEVKTNYEYLIDKNPEGKIIRKIEIVSEPPFITEKKSDFIKFFIKVGNSLHWQTNIDIIRDEVLFKEGERYSQEKIDENLKMLITIKQFASANIFPITVAGDSSKVDVIVVARDLWAIQINLDAKYLAGESNVTVPLIWRNAFGMRKEIEFKYHRDNYRTDLILIYRDPRILRSDWLLETQCQQSWLVENKNHDGYLYSIMFDKPFRSVYDKWHFNIQASKDKGTYKFYDGNSPKLTYFTPEGKALSSSSDISTNITGFTYDKKQAVLTAERGYGTFFKTIIGARAIYRDEAYGIFDGTQDFLNSNNFSKEEYLNFVAPRIKDPSVGLIIGNQNIRNVRLKNIDKFKVAEIFVIGYQLKLFADITNKSINATDDYYNFELDYNWGIMPSNNLLILGEGTASTRLTYPSDTTYETTIDNRVKIYILDVFNGLFAFNLASSFGKKNLPTEPFFLGGNAGLRGYEANTFKGNRLLRATSEYRTPPIDLSFLDLGFAFFYDVGKTWNEDKTDIEDVKTRHAVGLGIRTMALFMNPNVLRIDIGFPLNSDGTPGKDIRKGKLNSYISVEFHQSF